MRGLLTIRISAAAFLILLCTSCNSPSYKARQQQRSYMKYVQQMRGYKEKQQTKYFSNQPQSAPSGQNPERTGPEAMTPGTGGNPNPKVSATVEGQPADTGGATVQGPVGYPEPQPAASAPAPAP